MKPRKALMKRSPMPRGKPIERHTPMPRGGPIKAKQRPNGPVKARRQKDTGPVKSVKDLVKARAARDVQDGADLCEVCGQKPGTNIHHRQPRGAGGCPLPYINAPSNLLWVCGHGNAIPGCHSRIENDRPFGKAMGWLVPRPKSPVKVPVLRRGVRVWLDDQGDFAAVTDSGAPVGAEGGTPA